MAFDKAAAYLQSKGFGDRVMEFPVSSATVELAAVAVGTDPDKIAKSLTFLKEDHALMILCSGMSRVNNSKFKAQFGMKAKMLTPQEVTDMIGHDIGGVCPFGVKEGVEVWLDESLRAYDVIYPACGSSNSAARLTPEELLPLSGALGWVDVCKK